MVSICLCTAVAPCRYGQYLSLFVSARRQNLAYQADQKTKRAVLRRLGTSELFRLLSDASPAVLMKTLGLLRNLLTRPHVDQFMDDTHGPQVMQVSI